MGDAEMTVPSGETRDGVALAVERVRVSLEPTLAAALLALPRMAELAARVGEGDPDRVRRGLLARSLRLSEAMAPEVWAAAGRARDALGLDVALEVYQSAGRENAVIHRVRAPALVEIQGRLLTLLDGPSLVAVFGHELGHFLAHGLEGPVGAAGALASAVLEAGEEPARRLAARLSMTCELTADRFGLLACRSLDAVLRLEMACTTGLPTEALTWDPRAYLAQCTELMEACLRDGTYAQGMSHPEHNLRAWAAWLFSESDVYRSLTGDGPGTRPLAEVDALIGKVLGGGDLEGPQAMWEAPAAELFEGALACCVLVALADGVLADAEVAALEAAFGAKVPGWRSLLDRDAAAGRLQELGPLFTVRTPHAQRALFSLLMHTVLADGEVHGAELAMVEAIGEAFGCGREFHTLLEVALRSLGIASPARDPLPPPFAPPPGEAREGLEVFLRGAARRGGATVTLSRLLRILGHAQPNPAVLGDIQRAFDRVGLRGPDDLSLVDPETAFFLAPTAPPFEADGRASAVSLRSSLGAGAGAERVRLSRALTRLRDELVSGDGRSPSVRVHRPRNGQVFDLASLDRASVGRGERALAAVRAGRSVRLVDPAEAGAHAGAREVGVDLLALERNHRARAEETGARDLAVGYPVLTAVARGYLVRGPLVLHPVDLERDARGARGFTLRPEDTAPTVNHALLRLLFHKRGYQYPDSLAARLDALSADPTQGSEAVLLALGEVGLTARPATPGLVPLADRVEELGGWADDRAEVEECALLGLFPQSSSDLLQDYDGLLEDLSRPEADPGALLGCAGMLLPADLRAALGVTETVADETAAGEVRPVIPADPSQKAAIEAARTARALVVDGPPGTGKSQVIVNLVADALGRGLKVAVVCEKRAALDVVVQRMDGLGFRHVLALVHDVHDDRKGLYRQLAGRLESTVPTAWDPRPADQTAASLEATRRRLGDEDAALAWRLDDDDLTVGQLHALAAGLEAPAVPPPGALGAVAGREVPGLLGALEALRPWRSMLGPQSPWRDPTGQHPRPSFATMDPTALGAFAAALEAALGASRAVDAAVAAGGPHPGQYEDARGALEAVLAARGVRTAVGDYGAAAQLLAAGEVSSAHLDRVTEAAQTWGEAEAALVRFPARVTLSLDGAGEAALGVLLRWAGSFLRFFVIGWWMARGALRGSLATAWPESAGERLSKAFLESVLARLRASRAWGALDGAVVPLGLGHAVEGVAGRAGPWLVSLAALARQARSLYAARSALVRAGAWPSAWTPEALVLWEETLDARRAALDAEVHRRACVSALGHWLPWVTASDSTASLAALHAAWTRDAAALPAYDRALDRARAVYPGAESLAVSLTAALPDKPTAWREGACALWAAARIGRWAAGHPAAAEALRQARGDDSARLGASAGEAMRTLAAMEARRVLARLDEPAVVRTQSPEKGRRRTADQATREQMLKECRKQRNVMPLRTLARQYARAGLLDLLPVWLVSPETLAVLFPREPLFDLVIFDEASQCTVGAGVPALLRGRRVVVAGDERQMPPTSFFRAVSNDDEAEDEAEAEARDLLDAESLLGLAQARVSRAGLLWHYRCLHEPLIAYSNHALYEAGLRTIPSVASPAAPPAIRWEAVDDGVYEAGRNVPEARRVVSLLAEMLVSPEAPTLGVVTFNLPQRQAVLDEIDRLRADDPAFAQAWEVAAAHDRLDARPFVKNLENVQGDERDVIVFSLGHAPQARKGRGGASERYVPARFGPLGQRGGERRLNVAISRARKACVVVASFAPSMLSVGRSAHPGPRLFKGFLEYAWHISGGRNAQADRVLDTVRATGPAGAPARPGATLEGYTPLRVQVALALQRLGLAYELDVGTSDFKVPLAVLRPDDPTRYAVAVLCDEGETRLDPFERHAHHPAVLAARGWRVVRVTASAWRHDRPAEIARVLSAVPGSSPGAAC